MILWALRCCLVALSMAMWGSSVHSAEFPKGRLNDSATGLIMEQFLARAGLGQTGTQAAARLPVELESAQQDFASLTPDRSCHTHTPLRIGTHSYEKGLGAHANGRAVFRLNKPFRSFRTEVGVDNNNDTQGRRGSVAFVVRADDREIARTPICKGGEEPRPIEVALQETSRLELIITDAGDGISYDQADWADARLIDAQGEVIQLSDILRTSHPNPFLQQERLPASFVYGGENSDKLLAQWTRAEQPLTQKQDRFIHEITWREPGKGLVARWRVEAFKNKPVMEFRWIFENEGAKPTLILSRVCALDLQANVQPNRARLLHCTGGLTGNLQAEDLGFAFSETPLGKMTLSAAGGRSSNRDLPFFIIHDDASAAGLFAGIGWSGQWQAEFVYNRQVSRLQVTAEMPGMHLALPPGERLHTPSILLGIYSGNRSTGGNALRRVLYEDYVPHLEVRKPLPPVSWNSWFVLENTIHEDLLKQEADVAAEMGIEYFCIDAGWFDGDFPNGVGNWTINRTKFPHGLAPIGKYVAAKGMKLGLWFEPERVAANTRLAREHPEWVHKDLLDLGNAAAREWVLLMMQQFIDEGQVHWIRYDFNTDPLATWDGMDAPESRGLAQIRHVEGLYKLLDRLRARYPNLLIEGCASGGRRIDLETVRRSHTFWKSDETGSLPVMRFHQSGGNFFLPGGLLNANLVTPPASSDAFSLFGGPLGFGADLVKLTPAQRNLCRNEIALYKQVRAWINRDYYPLFRQQRDLSDWIGWQFHDPKADEGFLVTIRPQESPYSSAEVCWQAVDPARTYRLLSSDGSLLATKAGKELSAGWQVPPLRAGNSQLLRYRAVTPGESDP
jgi:alpha-galactosidase